MQIRDSDLCIRKDFVHSTAARLASGVVRRSEGKKPHTYRQLVCRSAKAAMKVRDVSCCISTRMEVGLGDCSPF